MGLLAPVVILRHLRTLRNVLGNIFEHPETPDVRYIAYIYNHWLI